MSRWMALVLIAVGVLAGCTQPRSREAFCRTLAQETQRYRDKYSQRFDQIGKTAQTREKTLSSLLSTTVETSVEALGDAVAIFDKLDKVAPEEIQPDVAASRDALRRQRDALRNVGNNPLGALTESFASTLVTMGSWERVSTYIDQNCPAEHARDDPDG
jgi:hypothetical protein